MTVQHILLQKSTNFHAIRSWSFQNIYNEIGWPRFLRHPVFPYFFWTLLFALHYVSETVTYLCVSLTLFVWLP